MRSDVSFTLFLADPDSYDGGELVIEQSADEQAFKLEAGSMILYPTTTLHRVEPVTRGTRVVAFGWVRSFVRSAERARNPFRSGARQAAVVRPGREEPNL
jgi:PKHD-type hydroxylase